MERDFKEVARERYEKLRKDMDEIRKEMKGLRKILGIPGKAQRKKKNREADVEPAMNDSFDANDESQKETEI